MKQIFTLFVLSFFAVAANAQFSEKFENYDALVSSCWILSGTQPQNTGQVIEGAASIETINTDPAVISTPYLDFIGLSTVSLKYRLSNKLNGHATRVIQIGTTDKNGTFTEAASITLDKNTSASSVNTFTQLAVSLPAGTRRFTIRVTAHQGDGNSKVVFDDLSISLVSRHYNPQSCNTAPVATDASFATRSYSTFSGNLSAYASDANTGESLTFSLETLLTNAGTLVVNPNGTFEFTPNEDFSGGDINFTYKVTDNGYDPLSSNVATVTINFASRAVLPVSIISFSGSLANHQAQLAWAIAENQEGDGFEVQKSSDGRNFATIATIKNSEKAGSEHYTFVDVNFKATAYYRLKANNKLSAASYSKIVMLQEKGTAATNRLTLQQNPVVSAISFSYTTTLAGTATVNLYTASGVKVFSTRMAVQNGLNQASLQPESPMAPGAYILEVVHGTERSIAKLLKP